ncbi:MAG: DUF4160 domain-containing protein [Allosphingosinicella sp.]
MVTVFRESGLRFVIYRDDHSPAHVHVFGDGATKITLGAEGETPEVVRTAGAKANEVRKALQIVIEQRTMLMVKWEEFHG